ncbi:MULTISPECIES: DUF443 family protein [Lacticaseibacillus]|uniref:DUF443 family protein n=2 Tax=Lacticaseibacillus TaxID=2759736 RepID=A0AAN1KEW5_LACCA|nr:MULTISPECIES: DUF443 family protein [Lacticaseibacillus]ARY92227.1 hypothetical protein BGL52_10870 [Lacticaseibacillus casei]KAB1971278.1 DUF443 family protein [Lacticaseibacillus casei]WLV80134.1 DUF443 family protein [Lacticaseibacillus sp. NCIMB 15473]WNX24093.1 DUF443 family protein [Lacticaseibacillus casei]WNX26867.1 DUF443 family protein [Lacticaseibacillus casei]
MHKAKFHYVKAYFTFEVVETTDGAVYLVDMGSPFIAWFALVSGCFIPRKCYPISGDEREKILQQKGPKARNVLFTGGIAVLISILSRDTLHIFSVSTNRTLRLLLILLVLMISVLIKWGAVCKAHNMIRSLGIALDERHSVKISFSVMSFRTLSKQIRIATVVWICLVFSLILNFQPVLNLINLLMMGVLFFGIVGISSFSFRENTEYIVKKIRET